MHPVSTGQGLSSNPLPSRPLPRPGAVPTPPKPSLCALAPRDFYSERAKASVGREVTRGWSWPGLWTGPTLLGCFPGQ